MEMDLEAEVGKDGHGHKRTDLEETTEGRVANGGGGGDAKRPREDLHSRSMEMWDDDDEDDWSFPPNPLDAHRKTCIWLYGANGASFEDETERPPMRHTDGPVLPPSAEPMDTMQVFYVKVTQITGALQWPLDVYGVVAVRDSLDHKRNILFRCGRDECQTLTSLQDSLLELRGPSCAVLLLDPPVFEIDLKVKGKGSPSEDKGLSYYAFEYNNIVHMAKASYAITEVVPSMEIKFAHLAYAVEATITVRVVGGSSDFRARFTARTASIDEDVVLLDSHGGKVAVADDGLVMLRRRVVVVEEKGKLILGVEATQGDTADSNTTGVKKQVGFPPRTALRSEGFFNLGFCRLHVMIAWSMLP